MTFLLAHIDSLIQIFIGLVFTWIGFRPGAPQARLRRMARILGPALVLIGGLLMLKPSASTPQPAAWQRHSTSDGVASAELPGKPVAQQLTDTVGDVTVTRTSLTYNVPGKDLSLFFSHSPLPEQARAMSTAERLEATLEYFKTQGFTIEQRSTLGPAQRVRVRHEEKKATVEMALAYVGDKVYRVVASCTDGSCDRALIDRFVGSFRM